MHVYVQPEDVALLQLDIATQQLVRYLQLVCFILFLDY